MPFVTFHVDKAARNNAHEPGEGQEFWASGGLTILEAARAAGIAVESPCNGLGTCGKCKVRITEPEAANPEIAPPFDGTDKLDTPAQCAASTTVLACQKKVDRNMAVFVRDYQAENSSLKIITSESRTLGFNYELKPFIVKDGPCFGLVVDIGTTTLVTSLIDIKTGKLVASESALNPQSGYAQDVLSRIHFASKPDGLETMHRTFIEIINLMIEKLSRESNIDRLHIYEAVYSGNTAMLHLACAVEPSSLGQYPYTPKIWGNSHVAATPLNISPEALIYLPPVISAYVGADITSGILATGLAEKKGATVFIDIGTNGEIVVARDGVMAASSTAAGPCFEGMNISCGMRASKGAIESFMVDDDGNLSFEVIGGKPDLPVPAAGICGSGLLDIAGELVRTGVIEKNGRFVSKHKQLREKDGKRAYFITDEVYLSQKDVRQIQLAKGAVRCGIEMLLAKLGIQPEKVDSVIIAGSFGYHLNEKSLINTGLLPAAFAGKASFAGNTSISGGVALLLNTRLREKMGRLTQQVEKVELADDPEFEKTFVRYLSF